MNVRPIEASDFEAVVDLLAADEAELLGRPSRIGLNDLREWISRTELVENSWLYEDDAGLCALGWLDAAPDHVSAIGVVAPGRKGRGIGALLLDRSEARAVELGAPRVQQLALGGDPAAVELLRSRGYAPVRRFYEMAIELEARPEVPQDVPIETAREDEVHAFHAALDEAFQDHWQHRGSPFEEWWSRHASNPNLDLGLWFVVRDGDEIAAVARNEANRNGGGYVGALGVRREWRGRGYAKALLLHTFREFYDRGLTRVTLGVDAENPTGATHLYERVGMHVELENVIYERALV